MARMSLIVVGIAVGALLVAPATAQSDSIWTDPTGRYTLHFSSLGWEGVELDSGNYFQIESLPARSRDKFLTCSGRVLGPIPNTGHVTQQQANVGSESFAAANVLNATPEAENVSVEHTTAAGVAIADIRFTVPSHGGLYQRWRTFFLATPVGVVQHQINCGGTLPISDTDEAEIEAVLDTLRFVSAT